MIRASRGPERAIESLAMALASVGALALMAVVGLTVANAVLRSLFANPVMGSDEVAMLLSLFAVVAFLPVSFLDEHHLEIDMVMRHLGGRIYWLAGIATAFLVAVFLAAMTWQLTLYAANTQRVGDATWFLMLKTWPWWVAVAAILAFTFLAQVMVVLRRVRSTGLEAGER